MNYRFISTAREISTLDSRKVSKMEWGIISSEGEVLLPIEYDEIGELIPGYDCFTVKQKGKRGLVGLDFKIRVPCIYDRIVPWGNHYFEVGQFPKDRRLITKPLWGIMSQKGEILLPIEYDEIYRHEADVGFIIVKSHSKYGIVDINFNKCIPCDYDMIEPWGNNLFKVTVWHGSEYDIHKHTYFIVNQSNARIDDIDYSYIGSLDSRLDNRAWATTSDGRDIYLDADGREIMIGKDNV